jgi:hypothetical protein
VQYGTEADLADLGDAGEAIRYLIGFWAFLFSPKYRAGVLRRWHHADEGTRSLMVIEGLVATVVGLALPLFIAWLLARG